MIRYVYPRKITLHTTGKLLKKNATALGIELVDVTAPDPTAEAGLSASQQFILEEG